MKSWLLDFPKRQLCSSGATSTLNTDWKQSVLVSCVFVCASDREPIFKRVVPKGR